MLDRLDTGRWEMRLRDPGSPTERLCVPNGRRFIQLRHPQSNCERFIVQDGPNEVTVQYTCRGKGYGRTHIRRGHAASSRSKARASLTGCRSNSPPKRAGWVTARPEERSCCRRLSCPCHCHCRGQRLALAECNPL